MKQERNLLQRLAEEMDLAGEPVPGQSVVELAGDSRVLIEKHFGMTQYTRDRICVKVRFGQIAVCGCGLELKQMTRERIVIAGRIDSVTILRRRA